MSVEEEQIVELTEQQIPQKLKSLWLKALGAMELKNYAFVINLCLAIVKECPGFLEARKLARKAALLNKGITEPAKGSPFAQKYSLSKLKSLLKKKNKDVLTFIEIELGKNPKSGELNDLLFEIGLVFNLLDTAAFGLETVKQVAASNNTHLLHKLAEHYLLRDMPEKSLEVYNAILSIDSMDADAQRGAKDASAKNSIKQQNLEKQMHDNIVQKNEQKGAQEQVVNNSNILEKQALTREEKKEKLTHLIELYKQDVNDLKVVKMIASIYEDIGYSMDAYMFYDWAFKLSDGDITLQNKAQAMHKKGSLEEIAKLEEKVKSFPSKEEYQIELAEKKQQLLENNVRETKQRVESNPTDATSRYNYGMALYEAGDYSEAITNLQQAVKNPHVKISGLLLLSKVFKAKKMYDLGVKQLDIALDDLAEMDDTKKELLYEKGCIHQLMEDDEKAIKAFKTIYEADYSYRDVAKIVESSY